MEPHTCSGCSSHDSVFDLFRMLSISLVDSRWSRAKAVLGLECISPLIASRSCAHETQNESLVVTFQNA